MVASSWGCRVRSISFFRLAPIRVHVSPTASTRNGSRPRKTTKKQRNGKRCRTSSKNSRRVRIQNPTPPIRVSTRKRWTQCDVYYTLTVVRRFRHESLIFLHIFWIQAATTWEVLIKKGGTNFYVIAAHAEYNFTTDTACNAMLAKSTVVSSVCVRIHILIPAIKRPLPSCGLPLSPSISIPVRHSRPPSSM
jgi:hypothetical protein